MARHTMSAEWDVVPDDVDERVLVQGGYRTYRCACGVPLADRVRAELHAMETNQCSVCLGGEQEEIVPGFARPCTACAGTGRRHVQLMWQTAHGEAEKVITVDLVRSVIARFAGPFRLSAAADAVRTLLGLTAGRLPVGPRVRDVLGELETSGEVVLLSAPDELLHGTSVVLYRDPHWQRVTRHDLPW